MDLRVISLDESNQITDEFIAGQYYWNRFTVGNFRRTSSGMSVAESATGGDLVMRMSDDDDVTDGWTQPTDWITGEGGGFLDMEIYEDQFYGCGSSIASTPRVFLPVGEQIQTVLLAEESGSNAYYGEMYDIDVKNDLVLVGGINQIRDVGMAYVADLSNGVDLTDRTNWTEIDISTYFPNNATWIRGVCIGQNNIYLIGEEPAQQWGFVLASSDKGQSFTDITPRENGDSVMPPVHQCQELDGTLVVVGGDGFWGTTRP